jgi:hypothetical protein
LQEKIPLVMVKPKKKKPGGLPPTMGLVSRACECTGHFRRHYPMYVIWTDRDKSGGRDYITSLAHYDGAKGWMRYIVNGLPVSDISYFYLQIIYLLTTIYNLTLSFQDNKKYDCHVQPDIPIIMMLQEFYRKFDLVLYELDFVEKGSDVVVDLTKTSLELECVNEEWLSFGEIDVNEVGMSTILAEVHLEAMKVRESDNDDDNSGMGYG